MKSKKKKSRPQIRQTKVELWLFLTLFLTYAYFFQGGGWNQNARFDQTRAIVEKGTFAIDDYVSNTGDWTKFGEHFYPNKPPGSSLSGVPVYFIIYHAEKLLAKDVSAHFFVSLNAWLTTIFSVGFLSALLGVILYKFLNLLSPETRRLNLLVTAGYALGTLAFPYSTIFHGHQLSAFFLFASFYFLFKGTERKKVTEKVPLSVIARSKATKQSRQKLRLPRSLWSLAMTKRLFFQQSGREYLITGGFLSGMAVMMEYQSAVLIILFLVWIFLRKSQKKLLPGYISGIIPPILFLAVYQWICFGNPLSTGRAFQNPLWLKGVKTFYGFVSPDFKILPQITFLPFRGLFFSSAWLILAIPGFVYLLKAEKFKKEAFLFLGIVCFYFLLNLSFYTWEGGWTCGPRYIIPMLPFMVVPVIFVMKKLPKLTNVLIAISMFFMLAATAVRPEIHPAIENPFFDYILPNFVRGELSLNPQGIDELRPLPEYLPANFYWFSISSTQLKKFFPDGEYPADFKQAKLNSFNLGELFGLPGLLSLFPLFALWGGVGFYLKRKV